MAAHVEQRLRRRLSNQAILTCRGLMSPRATGAPESKKRLPQKALDVKALMTTYHNYP
jgi:hypothetical protein